MKFKVINTYIAYNEIESIQEREAISLEAIQNKVHNELKTKDWFDPEFYGGKFSDHDAVRGVGVVKNGEENVYIIIPETHVMYTNVKHRLRDMTAEDWNEWIEFAESLF